jgi:Beta-propeller repeat
LRMGLANTSSSPQVAGTELLPGKSNYLIGNDPSQWHRDVPQFARVRYRDVYPGIDLVYYGKQGRLEYDFEVAPGAEPRQIALRFHESRDENAKKQDADNQDSAKPRIDRNGDLVLASAAGQVRLEAPRVYQEFGGQQRPVGGRFAQRADGTVGFDLGWYDRSRKLVIDPVLTYSTYLGGSGAESCSAITGQAFTPGCPAITVDSAQSAYIAGSTSSANFPVPAGGTSPALTGTANVFVTKFDSTGAALLFTTYLGGNGIDTTAGIAVDSGFDVFVAGTTSSSNFPVSSGARQSAPLAAGNHVFVTQLNSTGSAVLYSTYLSGSGVDTASGLALDTQAKAYVTGTTTSTDFPVTAGAFQTIAGCPPGGGTCSTPAGITQFFLARVDPSLTGAGSLPYSTYFGGANPANGVAIGGGVALDSTNNVYITGGTNFQHVGTATTDFPILNAVQACLDVPEATVPTTAPTCLTSPTATDAFVAKFNISTNVASGAQLQYSTYIGGSGSDVGYGIAVDSGGDAYITGSTTSGDFVLPTVTVPFQAGNGGGTDAFVAKVSAFTPPATTSTTATAVSLLYFSYLGGSGNDTGTAITVDSAQDARLTGWTESANFPAQSPFPQGATLGGGRDAFLTSLNTSAAAACVPAPTANPPVFCPSYSSYLGGIGTDMGTGIALDLQGGTYVTGETASGTGFPLLAALQGTLNGPSDAFVTKLGPIVNLGLTATASPSPVGVGSPVTFTYTITNLGDFVTGVTFTDTLSTTGAAGTSAAFTSATASPGSCGAAITGGTLQCNIGSLNTTASGATGATVTVVLTPTAPVTPSLTTLPGLGNSGNVSVSGSNFQKTATATATVSDFTLGVAPANATVVAGAPASYTVQVSPHPAIPASVSLAVGSGLPTGATAAFSTTPIANLSNGPVSSVLTVNTTARVTTTVDRWRRGGPFYAMWLPVSGLALLGVGIGRKSSRRRRALAGFMLAGFFSLLVLQAGCGTKSATTTTTGTPAGTYTLTINATSGSATRTTTVQLVVQ